MRLFRRTFVCTTSTLNFRTINCQMLGKQLKVSLTLLLALVAVLTITPAFARAQTARSPLSDPSSATNLLAWKTFRTPLDVEAINATTLWYNGDLATQALPNGVNFASNPDAHVFSDFVVTGANGWDISAVFSNNLMSAAITQANYEIRSGVSNGNAGTLLFSGTGTATQVATGRSFGGFTEYTVTISGLVIHLAPGTYFLNVAPIGAGVGVSYNSSTVGVNAVGTPPGNNANEFWRAAGSNYVPTAPQGNDFSNGVIGNATVPCGPQATTYVDDNWIGTPIGNDPDGAGPAMNFGCDSFATIQGGVNGVQTGGTVLVSSGTYTQAQVLIDRSMTVTGAGAATTIINGGNLPPPFAGAVRIVTPLGDAGTTTFSGFTVTNAGLSGETGVTHVNVYARPLNAAATTRITNNTILGVLANDNGFYTIRNVGTVEFDHNTITNHAFNPIVIERSEGPTNVHDNNIFGNNSTAYFNFTYAGTNVSAQQRVANNSINGSTASGIAFNSAFPAAPPFTGNFTNVLIANNTITQLGINREGITIQNRAAAGTEATGNIQNAVVSGNIVTGTDAAGSRGIRIAGLVTNTSITSNDVRNVERGFSTEVFNSHSATGTQAHFNNFVSNPGGFVSSVPASVNAENNWWGCNAGPGGVGCDAVSGIVDYDPWIVLRTTASPSAIPPFTTSTVTASMRFNSDGVDTSGSGTVPLTAVTFSATEGTMTPTSGTITAGEATSTFTSTSYNSGTACSTVDGETVCTPIVVQVADLTVTKTNNVSGVRPLNSAWIWTFNVTNSGTGDATFAAGQVVLRDNLPNANVTYGTPTSAANITCSISGTFDLVCTANAGGLTVAMATGFTVSVPVNGASAPGAYVNPRSGGACATDPDGSVDEGLNEGNNTCSDTVNVYGPPVVVKSFNPTSVNVSGTSTLSIAITNPAANPTGISGLTFNDVFPAGLQVAAVPAATNDCGGTFAPVAGATSISLTGGAIATSGATCTVTVRVQATTFGPKNNVVTVSSTEGGTSAPAAAVLGVGRAILDFDGDTISDYAVVRDSGVPVAAESGELVSDVSHPVSVTEIPGDETDRGRDGSLGSMHRGQYFMLSGERFDPLAPRVRRPEGVVTQMRWLIHTSGPSADIDLLFGTLDDFPVPVDYDGDGICDIAVWTGGAGAQFRVLTSSSGFVTTLVYTLGDSISNPTVVGDYDGDGRADPAVLNVNTGQWSYLGGPTHAVLTTVTPVGTFGGGFPSPGDYDGDGKYDFMLETRDGLNQSAAHFYQWNNNGTLTPPPTTNFVFGNYRDVIVPDDYDGDGRTDIGLASVIVNPIAWRIRLSPSGFLVGPVMFGDTDVDYPISGDYDGNHQGDINIWRPVGQFQSLLAPTFTPPSLDFSWGQPGDYPVAYYNSH